MLWMRVHKILNNSHNERRVGEKATVGELFSETRWFMKEAWEGGKTKQVIKMRFEGTFASQQGWVSGPL